MNALRAPLVAWLLALACAAPALADEPAAPPAGEVPPCGCSVPPAVPGSGDGNARC